MRRSKNSISSAIEGCKALMAKSEAGNLVVTLKIISNVISVVQTILGAKVRQIWPVD